MTVSWDDPRVRTLFSNKVVETLRPAHVWTEAFNQDYLGEVKGKGSTVIAFSFPDPTMNDYDVPTGDLDLSALSGTYQRLGAVSQEITVDMDKDWRIADDRVMDSLTDPKTFDALAKNAAFGAADLIDRDLARRLNASASSLGQTGTGTNSVPIVGHGVSDDMTAYTMIEIGQEGLKDNRVPAMDLHVFVPDWFMTMLRVDLRFSGFGTDMNRATARGEKIVELAGITIHETINALDGAGTAFKTKGDSNSQNRIIFAWEGASTYVPFIEPGSMTDYIAAGSNPLSHDNLLRSRFLWGAKVLQPDGVLYQTVQKGSYEA